MGNPYDDAKRVKFIDHADLMKAANMIGDKTARGEKRALVGGFALQLLGSPPYIAAMKMEANRSKDHADLEWMIANGRLDTGATRKVIHKHLGAFAAQEFDAFVAVVIWKKSEDLI